MGARPIAVLDSLRFGGIDSRNTHRLLPGVVEGIADYGNCVGIPTVAGETIFDDTYDTNCLVNAMAIGTVDVKKIAKGIAKGQGNPVIYIGALTGRDGIHGASFASAELTPENQARRSSVQVADPFMEKLLLEATLELIEKKLVVGIQDMGAAGLTSSSSEMSYRGEVGMEIDIDKVPKRETGMNAYETMLSESQERMLMVAKKGNEKAVEKILKKWGLHAVKIGKVIRQERLVIKEKGEIVADIPVRALTDSNYKYFPLKKQKGKKPEYLENINLAKDEVKVPEDLEAVFRNLLSSPNIACKNWVWEQYDHMVRTNTFVLPGSDAAVINMKHRDFMLAASVDGNGRYTYLDPYRGGAIAVAESARNVVCAGAQPAALTNCLNFANPEDPEIFWQFENTIQGMADAAKILGTPVISGNVSFYNEGEKGPIYPTPVVGMVGIIKGPGKKYMTQHLKDKGDVIILLGETKDEIGASEYLKTVHNLVKGPVPEIDLKKEKMLQKTCMHGIRKGYIKSAHDVSDGGLAITIAEACVSGRLQGKRNIGAYVELQSDIRVDALLFGETQSRIVITTSKENLNKMKQLAVKNRVALTEIGEVGGDRLIISVNWAAKAYSKRLNMRVDEIENLWRNGMNKYV